MQKWTLSEESCMTLEASTVFFLMSPENDGASLLVEHLSPISCSSLPGSGDEVLHCCGISAGW